jgi:hypothetical protein
VIYICEEDLGRSAEELAAWAKEEAPLLIRTWCGGAGCTIDQIGPYRLRIQSIGGRKELALRATLDVGPGRISGSLVFERKFPERETRFIRWLAHETIRRSAALTPM